VTEPDPDPAILDRWRSVRAAIDRAALAAGRDPGTVALLAVGKGHPAEASRRLLEAGQKSLGENRVQEAAGKWPALREQFPGVRFHLIGPLQSNKVRDAVMLADVIETLDRPRLAEALAREFDRTGRRLDCYVEVNIGAEPQKAGILPEAADAFIADCRERLALPIIGLMCIPPDGADPVPHFRRLAALAQHHGLAQLSMGMSGDFEAAIAAGSTQVRVGTAIYGARVYPPA
jgi:pyridoxal phosphate enzyme (YggS family)